MGVITWISSFAMFLPSSSSMFYPESNLNAATMFIQEFLNTYSNLGAGIAAFGGPDWSSEIPGRNDGKFGSSIQRDGKKGSPVVPGSHQKILAEGEYVMFSIAILRGQYEAGKYEGELFVPGEFFF